MLVRGMKVHFVYNIPKIFTMYIAAFVLAVNICFVRKYLRKRCQSLRDEIL